MVKPVQDFDINRSVMDAWVIIEALARRQYVSATIAELAEDLAMHPMTVRRLLLTWAELGIVKCKARGVWHLTDALMVRIPNLLRAALREELRQLDRPETCGGNDSPHAPPNYKTHGGVRGESFPPDEISSTPSLGDTDEP